MIQLKRFKYVVAQEMPIVRRLGMRRHGLGKQKIDLYVEFPVEDLDLSDYLLPGLAERITDPRQMHYELIGVVNHSGTADFGHYYAYCKDQYNGGNNWFEYNDSMVSAVRAEEVVTKNAYVLMYRRKDLGPSIYSEILGMSILPPTGKKGQDLLGAEKSVFHEEGKKLLRERKDGVDNDRKDGEETQLEVNEKQPEESTDMDGRQTHRRMSAHERRQLRKENKKKKK